MHRSKVMTRNTFHGDSRPCLWRWRAQAGREASLIAPIGSENERVRYCIEKLKARKRGASRDVYTSSRNILVANFILAIKVYRLRYT